MTATRATTPELTTEQVHGILSEPLRLASTFLSSGVRIFDTTGPIRFPKAPTLGIPGVPAGPNDEPPAVPAVPLGQGGAEFWHGEGESITQAEADHGELSLLPSTMKSVKVITRYSNELARASIVGIDGVLQSAMVTEVAQRIDAQFYGSGGDGTTTPKGILAWSGTQSVTSVGDLSIDALLSAQGLALGAGVQLDALRVYLRPDQFIYLRGLKDENGRYLLQPDPSKAGGMAVLGMGVTVAPFLPSGNAVVADPSQIVVARDAAPSVKVLTERYADTDEQAVRVVCRYDVGALNPAAVVKLTGITLNPPATPPGDD